MSSLSERLAALNATRVETLSTLAGLTEVELARPAPWRDGALDVRFLSLQLADSDDERRARLVETLHAAGRRPSQAQQILGDLAVMRGRVLAAIVGVPESVLDLPPAPGEWPLRAVIGHILNTERRYTIHSRYAADRAARVLAGEEPGPLRVADNLLPPLSAEGPAGDGVALRHALIEPQPATWDALAGVTDAQLDSPTDWAGFLVDLRFRLHRFAAHERQHLVQAYKTLQATGFRQSEAQLILGEAEMARAQLIAVTLGLPDAAAEQSQGGASVVELLREAEQGERTLLAAIRTALG